MSKSARVVRIPLTRGEIAGSLAAKRARAMGYCNTTADHLRRAALYDLRPDETPEQCAERIVAPPPTPIVRCLPQRVPA